MAKRRKQAHNRTFSNPPTALDKEARIKHEAAQALARNLERENRCGSYTTTQAYRADLARTENQRAYMLRQLASQIAYEHSGGECVDTTYTDLQQWADWHKRRKTQREGYLVEAAAITGRFGVYVGGKYRDDYDGPREGVTWADRARRDWWQHSMLWVQGAEAAGFARDDDDIVMHSTFPAVESRAVLNVKRAAEAIENARIVAAAKVEIIAVDFAVANGIVLPKAA